MQAIPRARVHEAVRSGGRPRAVLAAIPLALLAACGGPREPQLLRLSGVVMGSVTWNATVVVDEAPSAAERADLEQAVQDALAEIDETLSTYKPESELSAFNRAPADERCHVSRGFLGVLDVSRAVHTASQGAFDPTIGPLVNAWGFGPKEPTAAAPAPQAIEDALARVGLTEHVHSDEPTGAVWKSTDGVALDFSAVAKGWAVDDALRLLNARGYKHAMVEVGGEVRASGERAGGGPWRLAIEDPSQDPESPRVAGARVLLADAALATSGDYRNWRQLADGSRASHTIDPRTGSPIDSGTASASVIAPTCARADALATALMVLSPAEGLAMIEALEGVEALLQLREGDQLVLHRSSGWATHEPAPEPDPAR